MGETESALSVTVVSSPLACTAMFSAKKRANAIRPPSAPPLRRLAASASSASAQPPAAEANSRRYGVAPASAASGDLSSLPSSYAVARSRLSTASDSRMPVAPKAGSFACFTAATVRRNSSR